MSEEIDLSGAIDMLKDMLNGNDGKQQLQNILGALGGSSTGSESNQKNPDSDTIAMMFKMQKVMAAMQNGCNAKHTAFLQSLRDLLRPERRESIDKAVKILGVGSVIKAFSELEGV